MNTERYASPRAKVAEAIARTIELGELPGGLSVYRTLVQAPEVPAALINFETSPQTPSTMDGQEHEYWRVWIIADSQDLEEAALIVYGYSDECGDMSINAVMQSANAYWRSVDGISEMDVVGFARVPSDVQGPYWIDFNGATYWGLALLVRVLYTPQEML